MRKIGKIILFLTGLTFTHSVSSQTVWSEVNLNKQAVYVGEPVEVSITVYTSTWFTRGIDPGNIKVNGAFTVYFRPVTTSFQRDGQNYAGVQLIYNVFPYSEKDIVFPSLDIAVETPPEGDYKRLDPNRRDQANARCLNNQPPSARAPKPLPGALFFPV